MLFYWERFKMKTIYTDEIKEEIYVCPYCMNEVSMDDFGCCGESSNHFEDAYVMEDGECYLDSEVEIVERLPVGVKNEKT
jgi:hypothetical protein